MQRETGILPPSPRPTAESVSTSSVEQGALCNSERSLAWCATGTGHCSLRIASSLNTCVAFRHGDGKRRKNAREREAGGEEVKETLLRSRTVFHRRLLQRSLFSISAIMPQRERLLYIACNDVRKFEIDWKEKIFANYPENILFNFIKVHYYIFY